jgi:hypothetical protein
MCPRLKNDNLGLSSIPSFLAVKSSDHGLLATPVHGPGQAWATQRHHRRVDAHW